jgi:hypothetical protein
MAALDVQRCGPSREWGLGWAEASGDQPCVADPGIVVCTGMQFVMGDIQFILLVSLAVHQD